MSIRVLKALLKSMRPRQWLKNGFLFAAPFFDRQLLDPAVLGRTLAGFVLFSLLSSVVYLVNDLSDLEADRQHPVKRYRPLAAGEIPVRTAQAAVAGLLLMIIPLSVWLSPAFALICAGYFLLNLLYSHWLKHMVLIDVLVLAAFYLIRVGAGVVLIQVSTFSPWLYVFTTFLALFVGVGKRRAELNLLAEDANSHRKVLAGYTLPLLDQLMVIEEQYVSHIIQRVLKDCQPELISLHRDTSILEKVVSPFPRISYDDAASKLKDFYQAETDPEKKELLNFEWGMDFGAPHEAALTSMYDKPVFVYGYPTAVKAFYMEPWPGRPEICKSVDLLAPEGYGEIIGGSERMSSYDLLIQRIHEHGLPEEAYAWYLDLRKYGSVPHSGFGMGVERTVAWICGIEHIREAIPFPRTIKRVYP